MNHNKPERGQALVIIVFAMVALIGLTGLAIDGGNAYSDRRNAQNAADTAALAAALAKVRGADQPTWVTAGEQRAASNGYDPSKNSGATVTVYECDQTGYPSCNLPSTEDASQYVGVVITSNIRTYFAPVLGIRQMTNTVQAVAKAQPQTITTYFHGNTLVSTMPGCKNSQWNQDPFTIGGSADVTIGGSGVFVNSSCNPAFTENGGPSMNASGICVVGGVPSNTTGITPPPQGGCGAQTDYSQYVTEVPNCTQAGQINKSGGNWVASPGYYNSTFPNVSPAGTLILQKGIYCLNNGISLQSNWNITTDVNGNGTYDGATEGVLFYVPNGSVTFNGGSTIYLHAITTNTDSFPAELMGYLIYLPPTNTSPVKITGGSGSQFIGTIFAPASLVTLEGSSGTLSLDCQIIGYSLNVGGSGNINITYDSNVNAKAYTKPQIQLTK